MIDVTPRLFDEHARIEVANAAIRAAVIKAVEHGANPDEQVALSRELAFIFADLAMHFAEDAGEQSGPAFLTLVAKARDLALRLNGGSDR
jgi:hypothetical protein